MPTSILNGVRLHWELEGRGDLPLVLVHGSWGDHHNWARVVPALATLARVATYDRRGHSGSERPPGPGSVREDVADLAALIEHLFGTPAHVVGSSFGAAIALRLAGEHPQLVRSLVVHEPPLLGLLEGPAGADPAAVAVRERMARVVELLRGGDAEGGAQRFVDTVAFGPGAWAGLPAAVRDTFVANAATWLDEMDDPQALRMDLGTLAAFTAPTLLTTGGQSPAFFSAVMDRLQPALPQARRHLFAQAGHVPHQSHPEEYVRVVSDFILRSPTPG